MMKEKSRHYYRFGGFRIDVSERVLHSERGAVYLTPKVFDTLLFLVENSGHVLSKEELMQRVWPDSFVEENNLAQNISALRKALGEGKAEKFIETVPKRGYRFVAAVTESFEEAGARTPGSKVQTAGNEERREGGRASLRNVVLIGRAVKFK